ncbi:MAG: EthD family reductase [Acidimicrobiales bacterium]
MTVKLVALWSTPEDVEGFETHYRETHMPLAAELPALKGAVASRALDGPYYRMAELLFEDADGLQAAMGSTEGQALAQDAGQMQKSYGTKVEIMTVEEQTRI